ncbi:MAG: hypothetical protein RLZZ602_1240, partial [Pseudomonadota bacterium]
MSSWSPVKTLIKDATLVGNTVTVKG